MDSLFQFAAIFSALTWAMSGAILKQIKFNRFFSFPFLEATISLIIVSIIITLMQYWGTIFDASSKAFLYMITATALSCIGIVFYVISIKHNPIGVVFTLCAASTILMTLVIDFLINNVQYNAFLIIGAVVLITSIFIINFESFKNYKEKNTLGIFGGVIAGSIWGIAVILNDRALLEANILTASITRAVVSIIFLFILSELFKQRIEILTEKKEILKMVIAGSLITLSSLIWLTSLNVTTGSITSIFGNTAPVFAIIIGAVFLKEKIYKSQILGIFLAFIGVLMVILFKN